jgi:hypothetical protein
MAEKKQEIYPLLKIAVDLESAAFTMAANQMALASLRHQKASELKRLRDRLNSIIRNLRDHHARIHGRTGCSCGTIEKILQRGEK